MFGAWFFATIWNAISSIVPFIAYREIVENKNYLVLLAFLFPVIGIGLLVWAIQRTLEWRRFGPAPVRLDPFPGSIGGHTGGTIDLSLPFNHENKFQVSLTCIHSYVSGSGDNQRRKESAKWQDAIAASAKPGSNGTRLTFRFDVPAGLPESDADQDDSYNLWRLNLHSDLPGTDLNRDYEIPVYATATESRQLSNYVIERARAQQNLMHSHDVRDIVNLSHEVSGKRMFFPMGRSLFGALTGMLVGSAFAAVGWYLITTEGQRLFGGIFGGIGAIAALIFTYVMFNSLEVRQTHSALQITRRLFGIPIHRKTVQRGDIINLIKKSTMQSQSGGKHTIHYGVYAIDRSGEETILAEGFKGESMANAAIDLISREFGLRVKKPKAAIGEEDPLGPGPDDRQD